MKEKIKNAKPPIAGQFLFRISGIIF